VGGNPLYFHSHHQTIAMLRIIWLVFASAVVVVCGTIAVLKPHHTAPSADIQRVARKYAAALGGPARSKHISTREIRGTFEYRGSGQHGTGQLEMRWKAPNSLVEQLRGPMGVITRGYDGERAWGTHPQRGVRHLSSYEIDEIRLVAALYQPLIIHDRYREPTYEGRTNVRGRETEVLSAIRHGGRADRFYLDVVTGLPVQLDIWEEGPEAVRRPGEFYLAHYQLDDYRTVDGIAVPFYVRRVRPNSSMTFRFTEVRQNVALPDSIFRDPARSLNE
jgi:hypothetical protein